MKNSRIAASIAALGLAAAALTGCVSVDGGAPASSGPSSATQDTAGAPSSATTPAAPTSASSESTQGSAPAASPSDDASPSVDAQASAGGASAESDLGAAWASMVTKTIECSGETVTLSEPGTVVHLKGECASVVIDGAGVVVLADSIKKLSVGVAGAGSMVAVGSISDVTLEGTGVVVAYSGTKPSVTDTGTGNVVSDAPLPSAP